MSLSDSSNAVVYPAAEQISYFMDEALSEAIKGREQNEVPVGAVVVHGNSIIARAHNLTESRKDPTAHAEILAIREASRVLDNWRLTQCALYVTLEPCTMCTGALREARIPLLVFGTPDERLGACGSIYDLSQQKALGVVPRVVQGIKETECKQLLKDFFSSLRNSEKTSCE